METLGLREIFSEDFVFMIDEEKNAPAEDQSTDHT